MTVLLIITSIFQKRWNIFPKQSMFDSKKLKLLTNEHQTTDYSWHLCEDYK